MKTLLILLVSSVFFEITVGAHAAKIQGGTGLSVVLLGGVATSFLYLHLHPPPVGYYCQSLVLLCAFLLIRATFLSLLLAIEKFRLEYNYP